MTNDSGYAQPKYSIGDCVKPTRWAIAQFAAERSRQLVDSSGIVVSLSRRKDNKNALEDEDGSFVYCVLTACPSLDCPLLVHFFEHELKPLKQEKNIEP